MSKTKLEVTRRKVQVVLGVLWIIDALFQFQRQMFSANFANQVIHPVSVGQPLFVRGPIDFAVRVILTHPAFYNTLFALVQFYIGIFILWKRTVRLGLIGSMLWGLIVWFGGEAMGGLASAHAMILMGAPGAALLYAIIALAVFPKSPNDKDNKRPSDWLVLIWAALWLGGAMLQLVNGQNTSSDLASMIHSMNSSGTPVYLSYINNHIANLIGGLGEWFIAVLVITQALIGLLVLLPPKKLRTAMIWVGIAVSLVFWVVGQNLGGYYSGLATDVSTAPLFILLGIAILGTNFKMGNYLEGVV